MKKVLFFVLLIYTIASKAEYNGHYISFEILTKNSERISGHTYLVDISHYVASGSYEHYLEKHLGILLQNQFKDGFGSHAYFRHLVKYNYTNGNNEDSYAYLLLEKQNISLSEILSVKIIQMIPFTYLVNISSKHQVKDKEWIQHRAIDTALIKGHLCEWFINLHENSSESERVLRKLQKLEANIKANIKSLEEEKDNSDGRYYLEAEKKIYSLQEQKDTLFSDILEKLDGRTRTVVIQFCSC